MSGTNGVLASSLHACEILGKSLELSESEFLNQKNEITITDNICSAYFHRIVASIKKDKNK